MARLHSRLQGASPHADALRKLNTLTELGPPVGAGALVAFNELVAETAGCPLIMGVEEELASRAVCPACGLRLDEEPPVERVEEILHRIERAIQRQMARLSSAAVQQVLQRSGDARIEQFLKVVQAAQISSLADILDDELVGYLRRFLVEARVHSVLQPLLSHLEHGSPPDADEAREAMQQVARVLERAFRASRRALPPASKPTPPRDVTTQA